MSAQAISDILARSAAVKLATAEQCSVRAFEASKVIATSLKSGGKLLLCGNGGSAGDAQHLAAEFVDSHASPLEPPFSQQVDPYRRLYGALRRPRGL